MAYRTSEPGPFPARVFSKARRSPLPFDRGTSSRAAIIAEPPRTDIPASGYPNAYAAGWAGHDSAPHFDIGLLTGWLMQANFTQRLFSICRRTAPLALGAVALLSIAFLAREPLVNSAARTLDRLGRSAEMHGQVSVSLTKTVADIASKTVR